MSECNLDLTAQLRVLGATRVRPSDRDKTFEQLWQEWMADPTFVTRLNAMLAALGLRTYPVPAAREVSRD